MTGGKVECVSGVLPAGRLDRSHAIRRTRGPADVLPGLPEAGVN